MLKMKMMEITLVNETNEGSPVDYSNALLMVAKHFGGYSMHESKGAWESDGKLYEDSSKVLSVGVSGYTLLRARAFRKVLRTLFNDGGQLAVFVKLGSDAYVVEPNDMDEINKLFRNFSATN